MLSIKDADRIKQNKKYEDILSLSITQTPKKYL